MAVRAVVINFIYNSLSMEAANRLNLKMTLDEYLHEMNNRDQILQLKPSKTDVNDPLYCRKYAHTMIPLISYRMRPVGWDRVNVDGDSNKRAVYFGWNNITDFERKNRSSQLNLNANLKLRLGEDKIKSKNDHDKTRLF